MVTAIYNMVGKFGVLKNNPKQPMSRFQGLKCPTVLRDFSVQTLGMDRVPKFQIYLHNKTIASRKLWTLSESFFRYLELGQNFVNN